MRNRWNKLIRFSKLNAKTIMGFRLAQKIISNNPAVHYFIYDKHFGDVLHTLPYLPFFKHYYSKNEPYHFQKDGVLHYKKVWTVERIVVITNESLAGVARLFECVDEIITLPKKNWTILAFTQNRISVYITIFTATAMVHTEVMREGIFLSVCFLWIIHTGLS